MSDAFSASAELSAKWRDLCLDMMVNATIVSQTSPQGQSVLRACTAVKAFCDGHLQIVQEDEAREVARLAAILWTEHDAQRQSWNMKSVVATARELLVEARKQVADAKP